MVNDPKRQEELLGEKYKSSVTVMGVDHFLRHIEGLHREKGERWADITNGEGVAA